MEHATYLGDAINWRNFAAHDDWYGDAKKRVHDGQLGGDRLPALGDADATSRLAADIGPWGLDSRS